MTHSNSGKPVSLSPPDSNTNAHLVDQIKEALSDAVQRMPYDPNPERWPTVQKRVYPSKGRGRWFGRSMNMWRLKRAKRERWIGCDGNLYYYDLSLDAFLPAEYWHRTQQGLERLLRLIKSM